MCDNVLFSFKHISDVPQIEHGHKVPVLSSEDIATGGVEEQDYEVCIVLVSLDTKMQLDHAYIRISCISSQGVSLKCICIK